MKAEIKERIKKIKSGAFQEDYVIFNDKILPKDWKLENGFIKIFSGHGFKLAEYAKKGIPLIRINNIRSGKMDYSDLEFLNSDYRKVYSDFVLKKGDMLLALNRPVTQKQLKLSRLDIDEAILYQRVGKLLFEDGYSPEYYYQYLHSDKFISELLNLLVGSDQPYIKSSLFNKIKFPRPKIDEQQKIAEILSTWDKAIELREQLVKQKKEQKRGLMKKLLTGEVRLPGFTGEWKEITISKILKESKKIELAPDLEKFVSVRLHLKGVSKRDLVGNEVVGATTVYRRKKGQFIYGKQNFHNGAFGIIPNELDGFVSSSDIPAFDFMGNNSAQFFFYYWSRVDYYSGLESLTTGTGSKRLNPRDFLKISIKIPECNEQHKIADLLTTKDKEIDLLEQELETLKLQKKGLMQLLLTGIIRVPTEMR